MKFCHIAPTEWLVKNPYSMGNYDAHLILAHLLDTDEQYCQWYKHHGFPGVPLRIMDNGAFELGESYPPEKLIDLGKLCGASHIVLPDYPGQKSEKTIKAAITWAPKIINNNFKTFFVPQSEEGDIEDYITAFAWAASSPLVDYIGMSILGVPNAYGVYNNPLQRFYSRHQMMLELQNRGLLKLAYENQKKIHFLGMLDGPREIELVRVFLIDSWDSSAAVWAGLNGIAFDNSPTGLKNGKVHIPVDFSHKLDDIEKNWIADDNIQYINRLVADYKKLGEEATKKATKSPSIFNIMGG